MLPAQLYGLCRVLEELSVAPLPSLFLSWLVSAQLHTLPLVPRVYQTHLGLMWLFNVAWWESQNCNCWCCQAFEVSCLACLNIFLWLIYHYMIILLLTVKESGQTWKIFLPLVVTSNIAQNQWNCQGSNGPLRLVYPIKATRIYK